MSQPAIKVEGLWKEYVVGTEQDRHGTFYDLLSSAIKAPFRRLRQLGGEHAEADRFWALRDVNFEVQPGEVLGIIGRNGAGKSTLLKVLSRITAPTRGRVTVKGRMASLLEVGTGFHPELSGRENIYLNGAILGMTRREVARNFDEIVAFAEIEKFIDTAVKRYSSGMYVRLAFAVAAHLETDVLLVDEVLAVGDVSFQRKSMGKMGDAARTGKTVLLVSHNLAAMRNLCTRALVMEAGGVSVDSDVGDALARYERTLGSTIGILADAKFHGPMVGQIRFAKILCFQNGVVVEMIDPMAPLRIELHGSVGQDFESVELRIAFFRDGFDIASCHDTNIAQDLHKGEFISRFDIPADVFRPGRYSLGIGVAAALGNWVWGSDVAVLDFTENWGGRSADRSRGAVSIPHLGERVQ